MSSSEKESYTSNLTLPYSREAFASSSDEEKKKKTKKKKEKNAQTKKKAVRFAGPAAKKLKIKVPKKLTPMARKRREKEVKERAANAFQLLRQEAIAKAADAGAEDGYDSDAEDEGLSAVEVVALIRLLLQHVDEEMLNEDENEAVNEATDGDMDAFEIHIAALQEMLSEEVETLVFAHKARASDKSVQRSMFDVCLELGSAFQTLSQLSPSLAPLPLYDWFVIFFAKWLEYTNEQLIVWACRCVDNDTWKPEPLSAISTSVIDLFCALDGAVVMLQDFMWLLGQQHNSKYDILAVFEEMVDAVLRDYVELVFSMLAEKLGDDERKAIASMDTSELFRIKLETNADDNKARKAAKKRKLPWRKQKKEETQTTKRYDKYRLVSASKAAKVKTVTQKMLIQLNDMEMCRLNLYHMVTRLKAAARRNSFRKPNDAALAKSKLKRVNNGSDSDEDDSNDNSSELSSSQEENVCDFPRYGVDGEEFALLFKDCFAFMKESVERATLCVTHRLHKYLHPSLTILSDPDVVDDINAEDLATYRSEIDSILSPVYFYLDTQIGVMNNLLISSNFSRVLRHLWVHIQWDMQEMLVPQDNAVLTEEQVALIDSAIERLISYFHAGGEGLGQDRLRVASNRNRQLVLMHEMSTSDLVDYYAMHVKLGSDGEEGCAQALTILGMRKKDKKAKKFVKKHRK